MSTDPRAALQSLVNALEEHLAAAANRRSDDDPSVDGAYLAIANSFEAYEEALYDAYDEVTPLTVFADDDDSDDDYDEDEDDEDDLLEDNELLDEDLVDEDDYDEDDDSSADSSNGSRERR
ncbi:primosomal protein [Kocuria salsicia]|uniref:primosomal protein n=1 Tax=Kocuria salsicia TaxID=664639 RepID=UPI0033D16552